MGSGRTRAGNSDKLSDMGRARAWASRARAGLGPCRALRHTWPFQCDNVIREVVDAHCSARQAFVIKKYINLYFY